MRVDWVVIVLSLCSAFAFAVSTTLKHVSASQVPQVHHMRASVVARFVHATLSHPLWLGGIVADAVGLALQVLALHLGALAVVQPLLVSGLLFALLLRRREHWHLSVHELFWSAVLTACLVAFLFLSGTTSSSHQRDSPDRLPAVIAAVVGVLIAIVCVVLARHRRPAASSAALMGIAVGVIYVATAALLKGVSDVAVHGPLAVLNSWQLYTVLVVGGVGLFLNQLAFQAGPLTASLPAIATVDPLLSIVVGILIYDEHIHRGPWAGIGLAALMLLLATAVIELGKVDMNLNDPIADRPARDDATGELPGAAAVSARRR